MINQQHLIIPPPELVQQWLNEEADKGIFAEHLATRAAQWGADQELLAAGNYLKHCAAWEEEDITEFYNYRRPQPKPLSLKEQALNAINAIDAGTDVPGASDLIRRALEALPE